MSRQITYRWRLRELMAARGMFTVPELMPHLAERACPGPLPRVLRRPAPARPQ